MLKDDVIAAVKTKIKAEAEVVRTAVDEAEFAIRNYCKRWQKIDDATYEELPYGLLYTWANMAVAIVSMNETTAAGVSTDGAAVASIKEGDTTVTFESGATANSVAEIVNGMAGTLEQYRRLYPDVREDLVWGMARL